MAKLYLEVKNQTLSVRCDIDRIVENSINYLEYEIAFSEDWAQYTTKKIIVTYRGNTYERNIDNNKIPYEALCTPGFSISVLGFYLVGGKIEGRNVTNEVLIKVHPSGKLSGNNATDITPDATWTEEMENRIDILEEISGLSGAKDLVSRVKTNESDIATIQEEISVLPQIKEDILTLETNYTTQEEKLIKVQSISNTNKDNIDKLQEDMLKLEIVTKIEDKILVMQYKNS